jgi:poly(A) polymerase/tRNA nucleotidyltransferase (CCA-adding enzyme)
MARMPWESVADYVRWLGLDAWLVGGAVRDELLGKPIRDTDFVVPGVGHAELRAALEPHGKVEDLVVGGQNVGARLVPRERAVRRLAPAGIEFAPPRVERSTGPGRHDFEIVADASIPLVQDMERRDFTINAIAKRLETGELLDPLGGQADLRRQVLRTTSPTSFRDDPLRIVRGLRFISELDLEPEPATLAQMRAWAPQVRLVSGERIGGGLAADGRGELSKLLLGAQPAKALRLARDTGVLTAIIPEYEAAIGHETGTARQGMPVDEHIFETVQRGADLDVPLEVRLALLLHDLGKPTHEPGTSHADEAAELAGPVLDRLRYPTRVRDEVVHIVREHAFPVEPDVDGEAARRFLARHGDRLAQELLQHKRADLLAKQVEPWELPALDAMVRAVEAEREHPHRVRDLAIGGDELLALGIPEGPKVGRTLQALLDDVLADPARNTPEWLRERAKALA